MDFWVILEYTLTVSVVGLLIWLLKLVFHDKLDARWHYFIWLVLLVRLLVPVRVWRIPAALSVFQEIPLGKWLEMARILVEKRGYGDLTGLLWRVYVCGAFLLGGYYIVLWALLRLRAARAPGAEDKICRYVDGIAEKYGLKSCRDIRICKIAAPCICGVLHPVLLLPAKEEFPAEPVILHELLHRKYKDVLVNLGLHLVRVVNWFNPVLWILTAVVQNDGEALCDQRVLERCGQEKAGAYGELLISLGEGRSVKIGTSNMAGSYRDMKTRIRRIRDFRRVPPKIGPVALCITLMLTVAGVGVSAAEEGYFEAPAAETEREFERALLNARCYHARTPYEAVYLFLLAHRDCSTLYRMAVMPREEIPGYEEFARAWFEQQELHRWEELLTPEGEAYPSYFSRLPSEAVSYQIQNLQWEETEGSAIVYLVSSRYSGRALAEWKLSLTEEDGWKVWLEEEREIREEEHLCRPLLQERRQMGDFLLEVYGYNQGYFQQLEPGGSSLYTPNGVSCLITGEREEPESEFPRFFTMEYKCTEIVLTYLGETPLQGSRIRVEVSDEGGQVNEVREFFGEDLQKGAPEHIFGGGQGFPEPGYGWSPGDRMGIHAKIYVDGNLKEEGDVWNEDR